MSDAQVISFILGSVVLMLAFAGGVIWFLNNAQSKIIKSKLQEQALALQYQEELLVNTIKTQETERSRIAKELHDDVTSQLSIIHLNMHILKSKINKEDPTLNKIVDHIETSLKNSTDRTRTISHELMPAILEKFGFKQALDELANSVNMTEVVQLRITNDELLQIKDPFALLHVYRIIQELINNSLKYAKAETVTIDFTTTEDQITMTYKDDGVGFDANKQSSGLGLSNIKTRVKLLKGEIEIHSTPKNGVLITSKFPNYDEN